MPARPRGAPAAPLENNRLWSRRSSVSPPTPSGASTPTACPPSSVGAADGLPLAWLSVPAAPPRPAPRSLWARLTGATAACPPPPPPTDAEWERVQRRLQRQSCLLDLPIALAQADAYFSAQSLRDGALRHSLAPHTLLAWGLCENLLIGVRVLTLLSFTVCDHMHVLTRHFEDDWPLFERRVLREAWLAPDALPVLRVLLALHRRERQRDAAFAHLCHFARVGHERAKRQWALCIKRRAPIDERQRFEAQRRQWERMLDWGVEERLRAPSQRAANGGEWPHGVDLLLPPYTAKWLPLDARLAPPAYAAVCKTRSVAQAVWGIFGAPWRH